MTITASVGGIDRDDPALALLSLIADERAQTRADLVAATGLSRSTVAKRIQQLLDSGHVVEQGVVSSAGGRPSRLLTFNRGRGVAVGVDIGEDHTRVAVTDLGPAVLVEGLGETDLSAGPVAVLDWVNAEITRLLAQVDRTASDLVGVCLGLPAPVDWKRGRAVGPSVMRGWDGFDIRKAVRQAHDTRVVVDNDVNLLGLAESRRRGSETEDLLYIKAGTGIGSAIVAGGALYRGARGAAGDIGHIHLHSDLEPLCRCGNLGCVEASAAGWAIARDLRDAGIPADTARDVVDLAQGGKPEAIRMVREAGRALGEAVAASVSLLNPDVLVIGGVLASAGDHLLTGVREQVYRRVLPLSTSKLRIETAPHDEQAGVTGAAHLVIDQLLRP